MAQGKTVVTDILGFFNNNQPLLSTNYLCSKGVDFLHVTQYYCIC